MITKKDDYNNVPVEYCTKCVKLKILSLSSKDPRKKDIPYCGDCGSAEIDTCHISEHNSKYKDLYGKEYLTRNK